MKKYVFILLSFLYIGIASGINLHYKYCMNRLVDVAITYDTNESCPVCGGMHAENECCSEEQAYIKLSIDQDTTASFCYQYIPAVTALLFDLNDSYSQTSDKEMFRCCSCRPPIPVYSEPLYLRNCLLLI